MVRSFVSWTFYPGMLLAALWGTHAAVTSGLPPALVVFAVIIASSLPILAVQRWMPAQARWRALPRHYGLDLLHMASTGLATEGYRAATVGVFAATAIWLQGVLGATLWPSELPVWGQLAIALLMGDFGAYWVHRICHLSPLAWRIHAMHHSAERLYVFTSGRNHPVNAILAYGSQLLPLTLLGAPVEIIALLSVFTAVHGMLQHANIDLRHGVLNWVFSTADLHRWHHSVVIEESNTNFGSNTIVWDVVFGTRMLPQGSPEEVGLSDVALPENYFAHLASPFVLARWERPPAVVDASADAAVP